ncbi:MAG TPA: DUF6325 family protein [Microlunatus sp.]|nr:DUF6325 family protein [Microlunatus sp.]
MSEVDVGPIDYLAVEFPNGQLRGEALSILVDLVDRGIIRVLDLRVVRREPDGTFTSITLADLDGDGTLDLEIFTGVSSGLLDDDDIRQAAELIEPGSAVALVVYENSWAGPFVSALRRAGAEPIASGRIPADQVIAALEAIESETETESVDA